MAELMDYGLLAKLTYMTADEAAIYLRFRTTKAFRSYAARHGLVPCRDGRRVLYARLDLDTRHQTTRVAVLRSRSSRMSA